MIYRKKGPSEENVCGNDQSSDPGKIQSVKVAENKVYFIPEW